MGRVIATVVTSVSIIIIGGVVAIIIVGGNPAVETVITIVETTKAVEG